MNGDLITDIQPPDLETRIAILRKKAKAENLEIPNEAMIYIANQIDTNIRELEGALIRVVAYSSLINQDITVHLAAEALERYHSFQSSENHYNTGYSTRVGEFYGLKLRGFQSAKTNKSRGFPKTSSHVSYHGS